MKKIIVSLALLFCVSIIFAQETQENTSLSIDNPLPKKELALSVGDNLFFTDRNEKIKAFGTYTLSYHSYSKERFGYGAYFSFSNKINTWQNSTSAYSLAPSIRFLYFSNANVNVYWGLSLGLGIEVYSDDYYYFPFFQVTGFGFSYGKNFFVGGELGYGHKGIGCFNAGYKW